MADDVSLSAGDLNRRIQIMQPVYGVVADEKSDWTEWAAVWAQKRPIQGRELYTAMRETSELFTTFRIRYRSELPTTKMRVHHKGEVFDIRAVMHLDDGNQAIDLVCRKVV